MSKKSAPWPIIDDDPAVIEVLTEYSAVKVQLQRLYLERNEVVDLIKGLGESDQTPETAFLTFDSTIEVSNIPLRERLGRILQKITQGERIRDGLTQKLLTTRSRAATRAAAGCADRYAREINQPKLEALIVYLQRCDEDLAVKQHFADQGGDLTASYVHALGAFPTYDASLRQVVIQARSAGFDV